MGLPQHETITTVTHVYGKNKTGNSLSCSLLKHNLGFTVLLAVVWPAPVFALVSATKKRASVVLVLFSNSPDNIYNFHTGKYLLANISEKPNNLTTEILSIIWIRNQKFKGFMPAWQAVPKRPGVKLDVIFRYSSSYIIVLPSCTLLACGFTCLAKCIHILYFYWTNFH